MPTQAPSRPRSTLLSLLLLWLAFYASFTLFAPPLLDDADSVHAEVAREMLLRHDYVTLYANGIRYLEKAPLLYWSMAASMKLAMLCGATTPRTLAAAARIPLALTMLALALLVEAFARRLFRTTRAGLYAALILLSGFGLFIFTRITIPDAAVCLWIALALLCFWHTEELDGTINHPPESSRVRIWCFGFAIACALNVLTKGLIGVVFPAGIVLIYLLITRGPHRAVARLRLLHPLSSLAVFLVVASPWHLLAGLANPTQGYPTPFHFVNGHWQVPLPTDGNVRGWFWFYFMNEHLLRYLNLRVPHDYDTSPLWLFWGLCFVWLMPWSAFLFKAAAWAAPWRNEKWRSQLRRHDLPLRQRGQMLLLVWAAFVLLFFSLSTRQEYYVLPALPALALLLAGWLTQTGFDQSDDFGRALNRSAQRCTTVLLAIGAVFAGAATYFLLHTKAPAPNTDLASLLQENPGDYALSMGHFLDLNAHALGLFRIPLALAAVSLFLGPLAAYLLRKRSRPHAANLALAAGAFGFLLASHIGLQTFAPVLSSAQLAEAIAPQVQADDLVVIHGEYEAGSTLGFYLHRPSDFTIDSPGNRPGFGIGPHLFPINSIEILEGRSSNLWYGSFFPDAPQLFITPQYLAQQWTGSHRIFLWQSITDEPNQLPALPGPVYVVAKNGGKEIISNQPNR